MAIKAFGEKLMAITDGPSLMDHHRHVCFRSTKAHSGDDMKIVFWINTTGSQLARFWIGN